MAGWGYYPQQWASLHELGAGRTTLPCSSKGLLAWGLGRSYGDAGLAEHLLPMRQNRRILSFDTNTGCITVEAGVSLREIVSHCLPQGWCLPILPGTGEVTVGGAIAADVHGKNHHQRASFNTCVSAFEILTPGQGLLHCSPQENAELYQATMGGMGLTGVILRAHLQLEQGQGAFVRRTSLRCASLEEILEQLESRSASYSVAWLDGSSPAARGILHLGEPVQEETPQRWQSGLELTFPMRPPISLVNSFSLRCFNTMVWQSSRARPEYHSLQGFKPFFWPLDSIANWNRAYGSRGFLQFQCLLPWNDGDRASSLGFLKRALAGMRDTCGGSALTVLKLMGSNPGGGPLAFGASGVTLAADFPRTPASEKLVCSLNAECAENGGRVYLTKDALLSAELFRRMYPCYKDFSAVLDRYDPQAQMGGRMAKRLEIHR